MSALCPMQINYLLIILSNVFLLLECRIKLHSLFWGPTDLMSNLISVALAVDLYLLSHCFAARPVTRILELFYLVIQVTVMLSHTQ